MSLKIEVKRSFVVNGKEYRSEAEIPPEIRKACQGAMGSIGALRSNGSGRYSFRISLGKGKEREDGEARDDREDAGAPAAPRAGPITPGFLSPAMRKILFVAGIFLFLLEIVLRLFPVR